jgi:polar amino acid transport system substrate-binding protein
MRASSCQRVNIRRIGIVLLAFLTWQGTTETTAASATEPAVLRLANGEWPPHAGQHLPAHGCDSQVVSEVFALENIRVEYVFLPWARGLLLSQNGQVDGAVEWAATPEHRRTHFISSEPLSRQQWVFFHRRDQPVSWERLDDLHDRVVGLTIGYAYSDAFADLQKQRPAMFHEAAGDLLNFKKLLAGRIDIFPMERAVGRHLIANNLSAAEQAELTPHPKPLAEFSPHLLLSRAVPENAQRMQLFDQGLQRLKASGRHRQITAPCSPEGP